MNVRVSTRIQKLQPSATLAIDTKAKEMISRGVDVVNLGAGEPDFTTPDAIRDAAVVAIQEGHTKYTAVAGTAELKKAISGALKRDQDLVYDAEKEIIVSAGAKHSLYNVFLSLLDPGDEVILPAPYWVSYPDMIGLAEAKTVVVDSTMENGFVPSPDDIGRAVTSRTRMICVNSPSNPTGAGLPKEFMKAIVEIATKRDLLIVSDEIYRDITYDGFTCVSPAEISEEGRKRTILVNGVSKTYAMTGWRIGFTAAHPDVVKAMSKLQGQSTSNPSSISQKAATAAFNAPREIVKGMVEEFRRRMEFIVKGLNAIRGVKCPRPKGAFYVFPDVSAHYGKRVKDSQAMAEYLLEEGKVAAVHGAPFGADRHIRISFANAMPNLEKAVTRIGEALARL